MKIHTMVWKEVFERKNQLVTSFLSILLGITVIVAIKNITHYSEFAVARELDALGANILILPKSVALQDYYSADMQGAELPEQYVALIAMSKVQGVENLSPKLSFPIDIEGSRFILTGILPKSEFQAKAAWAGAGIFSRPIGCGADIPGLESLPATETLVRSRVIEDLGPNETLIGAEAAEDLGLEQGDSLSVLGNSFQVTAVLPRTGTVDDSRVFVHLHRVQEIAGKGAVVNAIEIIGCCQEIAGGMVEDLNKLLPDAKVVTISQIIDTQIKTNRMMANLSLVFLIVIVLVGGAGIANYMYANVYERRREIGTLMALGAGSGTVLRIFLLKALLLGSAGGMGGYVLGTLLAVILGPKIAGVVVLPMPLLAFWATGVSILIAVAASYFPARRAARIDPTISLQEV